MRGSGSAASSCFCSRRPDSSFRSCTASGDLSPRGDEAERRRRREREITDQTLVDLEVDRAEYVQRMAERAEQRPQDTVQVEAPERALPAPVPGDETSGCPGNPPGLDPVS